MIRPLALTRQVWHTASQIQRATSLGCPWNNLPRHRNPDTPLKFGVLPNFRNQTNIDPLLNLRKKNISASFDDRGECIDFY